MIPDMTRCDKMRPDPTKYYATDQDPARFQKYTFCITFTGKRRWRGGGTTGPQTIGSGLAGVSWAHIW